MKKLGVLFLSGAVSTLAGVSSNAVGAEPGSWYIDAGPARIDFDESAPISAAGNPIAQSDLKATGDTILGLGFGRYLSESLSVHLLAGNPPSSEITGAGSLAGVLVGEVDYAPLVLTLNYHFQRHAQLGFHVGGGLVYFKVLDEDDAQVLDLKVDDAVGFALRAGADYRFNDTGSAFLSITKASLKTDVSGTAAAALPGVGGAPLAGEADLDPLAIHIGYRHNF